MWNFFVRQVLLLPFFSFQFSFAVRKSFIPTNGYMCATSYTYISNYKLDLMCYPMKLEEIPDAAKRNFAVA